MTAEILFTALGHGKFAALVAGMPESTCQGALLLLGTQPTRDNSDVWVKLRCKGCNTLFSLVGRWHFHESIQLPVRKPVVFVERDVPPWGPDPAPQPGDN